MEDIKSYWNGTKAGKSLYGGRFCFEDEKTEGAWNYPVVWKDTEKNKWLAIYGQALPFAYDEKAGFCIKNSGILQTRQ